MEVMVNDDTALAKPADSSVPLHPLLQSRWSPRAFDPENELTAGQFTALFEAARWAPSWGNTQPARYIAGQRGDDTFKRIFHTLADGNKAWAESAAVLVIGAARTLDESGEPFPYGEYGLGLATENLVLQAVAEGLVAHQMAGFDRDAASAEFDIPVEFEPLVAIAVGAQGAVDALPKGLQDREVAERTRHPLPQLVYGGSWGNALF